MIEAKIRKVGNSAVMTLSTEMLALLDAKEGDTLYAVRTDDGGLKLMTENPELQAALAAAEIVMDENRRRSGSGPDTGVHWSSSAVPAPREKPPLAALAWQSTGGGNISEGADA